MSADGFEVGEDVVAAASDLAGSCQCRWLRAGALSDSLVKLVVGATLSTGVPGRLDQRPAKLRGARFGKSASALRLSRLEHDRIEAGNADELARAAEAPRITNLGE